MTNLTSPGRPLEILIWIKLIVFVGMRAHVRIYTMTEEKILSRFFYQDILR